VKSRGGSEIALRTSLPERDGEEKGNSLRQHLYALPEALRGADISLPSRSARALNSLAALVAARFVPEVKALFSHD